MAGAQSLRGPQGPLPEGWFVALVTLGSELLDNRMYGTLRHVLGCAELSAHITVFDS